MAQQPGYPEPALPGGILLPRPVKWSRDVHLIRERALRSKTETWSRPDLEHLFGIRPSSAQSLMKAIGGVQAVGGTHFIERSALLEFLEAMIAADSVEAALAARLARAEPAPRSKALRVSLPEDLRGAMLPDLPRNVTLSPGRIEITAPTAAGMVEALMTLALVMQNDLERWQRLIEPPPEPAAVDEDLKRFLAHLRQTQG